MNKRLVLIDTSCVAFQLGAIADSQVNPWDALAALISTYDGNGGLIERDPDELISVIWCFDSKAEFEFGRGYWRHEELRKLGIQYKPGRPDNPGISKIKLAIANRIPISRQARQLGFEADDVIAKLSQQYNEYPIDIITVDTDLMQLISNQIRWINTARYTPIIRGIDEARQYCLRRWRTRINSPRDIVDIKSTRGDEADGLPKGTDPGYIDLLNPLVRCPYHHSFPLEWWKPTGNTSGIHYNSASSPLLMLKPEGYILFGSRA